MKKFVAMTAAVAIAMAYGEEAKEETEKEEKEGWSYEVGEGLSFGEQSILSAEAGVKFDSKYLYYGLPCNKDPILTPSATLTFMDWAYVGVSAIFDVTKYGKRRFDDGSRFYGNRAGRYTELDPEVGISHTFSKDDYDWLPTTIDFTLAYWYEYHPRHMGGGTGEWGDDTQFVYTEISLPDLWVEPKLYIERDIDRDNGTYVNFELGHTISIIDGEGEDDDPVLAFRPSVGQGFGNSLRTRGYEISEEHGGLMDTNIKGELTWNVGGGLSLSAYVAYYDYIFDSHLREGARAYEASGHDDRSYNFVGGLALNLAF